MLRLLYAILFLSPFIGQAESSNSKIVASIKPIHSLVAGVMGQTDQPVLLVNGIVSPHGYTLKLSQRKVLEQANIVFLVEPHFEGFLAKSLHSLPEHVRVVSLAHAGGVTVLDHRSGGAWEAHDHSAHTHAEDTHETSHDHDHADHHDHSDHESHHKDHSDLHIWLSPNNAIAMTKAIAKELGKVYPENRRIYKDNAKTQIAKLKVLETEISSTLEPVKDVPFIVFHDAYQYLEYQYGLTNVGSITLEPDQKVSIKRIREIRQKLADTKATCVFKEPQFDDKLIKTVTEGTDVRIGVLDPIGANIPAGANLYSTMVRDLAQNLAECLAKE